MALKRLPKEFDYSSVRYDNPPKKGERRGVVERDARSDVDPTPAPDLIGPVEPAMPDALDEGGEPTAAGEAVSTDDAAAGRSETVAAPRQTPVEEGPAQPSDETVATPAPASGRARSVPPDAGAVVIVRGYVLAPETGQYPTFDELVAAYGEKRTVGRCLTAGMRAYEAALRAGAPPPPALPGYGRRPRIEAQRKMAADAYDMAVSHVDPKGFLGSSQLGSQIFATAFQLGLSDD